MPTFRLVQPHAVAPQITLDDSQRAVLDSDAKIIRVLGAAGTGKTSTLVELVAERISAGLDPNRVLALHLDRQAADDFATRVATKLGSGVGVIASHTFYSLAVKMWATHTQPENISLTRIDKGTQVLRLAELLPNSNVVWPDRLREAVKTRSFARHISDFIGRMAVLGIDEAELIDRAEKAGRDDWKALAQFKKEFDEICNLANETYFAQMMEDAEHYAKEYSFDLIVVDAFEEIDDAQFRVLHNLMEPSTTLVVMSDPDQSVNAFRGSTRSATWDFEQKFPSESVQSFTLNTNHRSVSELAGAAHAMIRKTGEIPIAEYRGMRAAQIARAIDPVEAAAHPPLSVKTFDSSTVEAEHIANIIRDAHLRDKIPYSEIAVLTRRGGESHRLIAQALNRYEIPAKVPLEQIKLIDQPAVNAIAEAADVCIAIAHDREVDPETVISVLQGPVFDMDPYWLRKYARHLRKRARANKELIRSSHALAALIIDENRIIEDGKYETTIVKIRKAATVIRRAVEQINQGADAEQVLWTLWSDSGWDRRIRGQLESTPGDRTANLDADAVVALFEQAAQSAETSRLRLETFISELRNQEIPNNPMRPRGLSNEAVAIMTAHRSKGQEFRFVVIAGVQENLWPTTSAAASILGEDQLESLLYGDGSLSQGITPQVLRNEDRRLFYLALSRAKDRVLVTAAGSLTGESPEAPSRFVEEMAGLEFAHYEHVIRRPEKALTISDTVAQLRILGTRNPELKEQAAARLAELIPVTDSANPQNWWGVKDPTDSTEPLHHAGEAIRISASQAKTMTQCTLRWYFESRAKLNPENNAAAVFGSLVHAVAEVSDSPDFDRQKASALLDEIWSNVPYDYPSQAKRERQEAELALDRYFAWRSENADRTVTASEQMFVAELVVDEQQFIVKGFIDRVEIDSNGKYYLIDFKTSRSAETGKDLERHVQMGMYDLAARQGAIPGVPAEVEEELVYLRVPDKEMPELPVVSAVKKESTTVATEALSNSIEVLNEELLIARPSNTNCKYCAFEDLCPAKNGISVLEGKK